MSLEVKQPVYVEKIYNVRMDLNVMHKLFKEMKIDYKKDFCELEELEISNISLTTKFCEFLKLSENSMIKNIEFEKINIDKFYFSREIESFKSCYGNVKININWLNSEFKSIFNKAIIDVLPRILKSNLTIYPKSTELFKWTCFSDPNKIKLIFLYHSPYISSESRHNQDVINNIAFAINPNFKSNLLLETIFKKMCFQLDLEVDYHKWFSEGNFYQNMSDVLFLNIGQTTSFENNKIIDHLKYWRHFIKNLLIVLLKNKIDIVCFGLEAKKLVEKLTDKYIYDIDPLIKNKPHDYLSNPDYFVKFRHIFNL